MSGGRGMRRRSRTTPLPRDLWRFLRGVAYMQDDDLASRIVDRIKDHERIAHYRQHSDACLVGQVSNERELAKERPQFLDASVTEIAADRLRS